MPHCESPTHLFGTRGENARNYLFLQEVTFCADASLDAKALSAVSNLLKDFPYDPEHPISFWWSTNRRGFEQQSRKLPLQLINRIMDPTDLSAWTQILDSNYGNIDEATIQFSIENLK